MPVFPIIVTPTSPPPVEIATFAPMTYTELVASLNSINYKVKYIYFQCDDVAQLSTAYSINKLDPKGETQAHGISPIVDPGQFQPTLYYDATKDDFIINNLNTLSFDLMPGKSVQLYFFNDSTSFEYLLYQKEQADQAAVAAPAAGDGGGAASDAANKKVVFNCIALFVVGGAVGIIIHKIVKG